MIQYKKLSSVRTTFKCIDSKNCLLWHKLLPKAHLEEHDESAVLCQRCKRLRSDLEHQRRRSDVSPAKQLLPSSNFKLKHLSSRSVTKWKQVTQRERTRYKAAIAKTNNDIVIESDQSDEVDQSMQTIENEAGDELEEVVQETPGGRSIWNDDRRNPKADFFKNQQQNCKLLHSCSSVYYVFFRQWKKVKLLEYYHHQDR